MLFGGGKEKEMKIDTHENVSRKFIFRLTLKWTLELTLQYHFKNRQKLLLVMVAKKTVYLDVKALHQLKK